ncbi:LLM class flavin-dependent oxidoreductase [Larkinella harenae]
MKLGLLEFGTGCVSPMDIVENVLEYAQQAEELGYTRFWLGEHYGASSAYTNPEALIPVIAGLTSRINVGVAGLLMAYHNPYRVATVFKLLNNLFPHRIDLGIAGGHVPPETALKLAPDLDFSQPFVKTSTFLRNSKAVYDYLYAPENANQITPHGGYLPTVWSLSAGLNNGPAIARQQSALCKSVFHTQIEDHHQDADRLQQYRAAFYSHHQTEPQITLAVAGVCARTNQQAHQIRNALKRPVSVASELIGSPSFILDQLAVLRERYGVNEFIFLNMAEETRHKRAGIEWLARALPAYGDTVFTTSDVTAVL